MLPSEKSKKKPGRPPIGEVPMPASERVSKSRKTKEASQGKRIEVMLSPEANSALDQIKRDRPGQSVKDLINALLLDEQARLLRGTNEKESQ